MGARARASIQKALCIPAIFVYEGVDARPPPRHGGYPQIRDQGFVGFFEGLGINSFQRDLIDVVLDRKSIREENVSLVVMRHPGQIFVADNLEGTVRLLFCHARIQVHRQGLHIR